MLYSRRLRKWIRGRLRAAGSGGAAPSATAAPNGSEGTPALRADDVTIEGTGLMVRVRPAVAVRDLVVQLASKGGQVLDSALVEGKRVRIVPNEPIQVRLSLEKVDLPLRVGSYHLDVSQGEWHTGLMLSLVRRADRFEKGYATVDEYLKSVAEGGPVAAVMCPQGAGERLSMGHMNDEDFTQYAYLWLLGRDADPVGFQGYLDALQSGLPREDVIDRIFASEESVNYRRLAPPAQSGQADYPFSPAHDRMRLAIGALALNEDEEGKKRRIVGTRRSIDSSEQRSLRSTQNGALPMTPRAPKPIAHGGEEEITRASVHASHPPTKP